MSEWKEIAALYVIKNGPYYGLDQVDPWDKERDARLYKGPYPVIAHPPCQRWGRYWGGGPMLHGTPNQKLLGDDDGCFAHALWAVRTFGGILEHPEASHAFKWFGLPIPSFNGGWTEPDRYGGRSCCVAQGYYGHVMQKMTWLYLRAGSYPELRWGRCAGKVRMDDGFHSRDERSRLKPTRQRQAAKSVRDLTPLPFRNLLLEMVA